MKVLSFLAATSLCLYSLAGLANVSCPNLPAGTYQYGEKINGYWRLWLGQSGELTIPKGQPFVWQKPNYNYAYTAGNMQGPGVASCFYSNDDRSKRFELLYMSSRSMSCFKPQSPGVFKYHCKTNDFKES